MKLIYTDKREIDGDIYSLERTGNILTECWERYNSLKLGKITIEEFKQLLKDGESFIKAKAAELLNGKSQIMALGFSFKKSNVLNIVENPEIDSFIEWYDNNIKSSYTKLHYALADFDFNKGVFTVKETTKTGIAAKHSIFVDGKKEEAYIAYQQIVLALNTLRKLKKYHQIADHFLTLGRLINLDKETDSFSIDKKNFNKIDI